MSKTVIRTPYDGLPTHDPGVRCTKEESKTIQAHKEYCDIDKQLLQAGAGHLLTGNAKTPIYGDFSQTPKSMHEAFSFVEQMKADFMQHSPEVRLRFNNDPSSLAAFLQDPSKMEESYKLGLRVKPVINEPAPDPDAVFAQRVKKAMDSLKTTAPTSGAGALTA